MTQMHAFAKGQICSNTKTVDRYGIGHHRFMRLPDNRHKR